MALVGLFELLVEIEQHFVTWSGLSHVSLEYLRACKNGIMRLDAMQQQKNGETDAISGSADEVGETTKDVELVHTTSVKDLAELVAMRQFALIDSLFKTLELNSLKMQGVLDLYKDVVERAREIFEGTCTDSLLSGLKKVSGDPETRNALALKRTVQDITQWGDHKTPSALEQFQTILQVVDQLHSELLHKKLLIHSLSRWALDFFASPETRTPNLLDPERFLSATIDAWRLTSLSVSQLSRLLEFFSCE